MFFSVRKSMRIGDRVFRPCICYEVDSIYESVVCELAGKDLAVVWPKRVFFQNGRVIDRSVHRKKTQPEPAVVRESVPVAEQAPEEVTEEGQKVSEETQADTPKARKNKKRV